MDRSELGEAFVRAFPMEPVAGLIVPEAELVALTLAARSVVFSDADTDEQFRALVIALDKASEPFADMLELPFAEASVKLAELRGSAGHVRDWLDAGCITLPPVHHIRALMESLI